MLTNTCCCFFKWSWMSCFTHIITANWRDEIRDQPQHWLILLDPLFSSEEDSSHDHHKSLQSCPKNELAHSFFTGHFKYLTHWNDIKLKCMWKIQINGSWPELKTKIRPLDLSEFLTFLTSYSDILENHKVISFHTKHEIVQIDHNILNALMVAELQNKLLFNRRSCQ